MAGPVRVERSKNPQALQPWLVRISGHVKRFMVRRMAIETAAQDRTFHDPRYKAARAVFDAERQRIMAEHRAAVEAETPPEEAR